jgi:hypothetical protein
MALAMGILLDSPGHLAILGRYAKFHKDALLM